MSNIRQLLDEYEPLDEKDMERIEALLDRDYIHAGDWGGDVESIDGDMEHLIADWYRLRAVVRDLTAGTAGSYYDIRNGDRACCHCGRFWDAQLPQAHAPDCPIVQGRELVGLAKPSKETKGADDAKVS